MTNSRFEELWEKYLLDSMTEEDAVELQQLLKEDSGLVLGGIDEVLRDREFTGLAPKEKEEWMLQEIMKKAKRGVVRRMPGYVRWVAAACLMFLVFGFWFLVVKKSEVGGRKSEIAVTKDVEAPKETRAMITLADGRTVPVDSLTMIDQGGVSLVRNENGEIEYSSKFQVQSQEIQYNTISNPRGSKVVSLTLSDGTKVWLNAESSLRYPVAFVGAERKVEITGEAYFEVRGQKSEVGGQKKPFLVDANGVVTEVLGTHFNVNAYPDEEETKVTLLEGRVRVKSEVGGQKSEVLIKPGQQAIKGSHSPLTIHHSPDLEEVMAWKNGKFSFDKDDIKTVMRQLARWYDIEVVYEGKPTTDRFWGDIQRDLPLSKTLDFLKKSQVHFEVEGKKVIVKP